jgi:hypothetical protein
MKRIVPLLLVFGLVVGWLVVMSTPTSAAACPTGWGSLPKVNSVSSQAHITTVRAGTNECYDRLVFDVNGPAPGWSVRYVDNVFAEGTGAVLPSLYLDKSITSGDRRRLTLVRCWRHPRISLRLY